MARPETAVNDSDERHIEYTEGSERSTLVVRTPAVTITIEGDPEEVRREFERHYADAVDEPPEEIADAVGSYSMPDADDLDSVSAEEFYGE
jgi:hypothetical protein